MTRIATVLLGAALWTPACTITVNDPKDQSSTDTGATAGDDDDDDGGGNTTDTDPPAGDDDDDDDDGGSVDGCAGSYTGTYDGAESGSFEADVDVTDMLVYISDVSGHGLDGILDLEADGSMYGESQGYWMEGQLDTSDCSMSGDWGSTVLPGVAAGTWQTD